MTRRLNARHIETFRAVMLSGTTTAAAQLLHATQPGVSRTLGQFQSATGLKLFEKHRGRLLPTPEAKELFDSVQRHFLGLEQIEHMADTLKKSGVGLLRVACTPVLGLAVVPQIIRLFEVDYPSLRMSLHTVETHFMRDGLLSGTYDLALTTSDIRTSGLEPTTLNRTRSVCVMSPDHPLVGRREIRVEDLGNYPLLAHHPDDALQNKLQQLLLKSDTTPPSIIATNYSATICALAAVGIGIGIVSPYAASVFAGVLHTAKFSPALYVETQLAFAPTTAPSRVASDFAARATAYLRNWTGKNRSS